MTPKQAVHLEERIRKQGLRLYKSSAIMHQMVREFRESGAWAITDQHHRSWSEWCRWFAPQIKMRPATLQTLGNPNYKDRWQRTQDYRSPKTGRVICLNVTGKPAIAMREAVDRAHELGIKEFRRKATERALVAIAKYYIIHATREDCGQHNVPHNQKTFKTVDKRGRKIRTSRAQKVQAGEIFKEYIREGHKNRIRLRSIDPAQEAHVS
jgi:hypothetical protein